MSVEPDTPTPAEDADAAVSTAPEPERVRTGVAGVDEVIAAVEELEERPIEEHVGVFETAHERLRRALDAAEDPTPGGTGGDPGDPTA